MPLDTRIALSGTNPLDTQNKLMTLNELGDQQQMRGLQMQQTRDGMQRQQQLRGLLGGLAPNTGDDQRISALRGAGYFEEADKLQAGVLNRNKTNAEVSHLGAQTGKLGAETGKITQETWEQRRQTAIKDILGFNSPEEARQSLIDSVRSGKVDQDIGEQMHRGIPQDLGAFRQWQNGMARRIMEAKDSSAALTPNLQVEDFGGSKVIIDRNSVTRGDAPTTFAKTQTPDSVAGNATTMRGQNMTDARAREGNDIARSAARTQIVETPDGYALVDRGTGLARPAAMMSGAQVHGKDAGLNDSQSKALLFGARMKEADRILSTMSAQDVNLPSLIKQSVEGAPLVGGALGAAANVLVASPQQQQVEQAQRDFVNAVLRRESGAAISQTEFDSARKQYFLQPGDSGAVAKQKAENRQLATRGLLAEVPTNKRTMIDNPADSIVPAAPQVNSVKDGYVFTGGDPSVASNWRKVSK